MRTNRQFDCDRCKEKRTLTPTGGGLKFVFYLRR
jgi:hypothetical protein